MTQSATSSSLLAASSLGPNAQVTSYSIPFQNPLVRPSVGGTYDTTTSTYTCRQSGPYLFSISAAVAGTCYAVYRSSLTSPSIHPYITFETSVVNHLHWHWQPNWNSKDKTRITENLKKTRNKSIVPRRTMHTGRNWCQSTESENGVNDCVNNNHA